MEKRSTPKEALSRARDVFWALKKRCRLHEIRNDQ
jgi:hypothetical protein